MWSALFRTALGLHRDDSDVALNLHKVFNIQTRVKCYIVCGSRCEMTGFEKSATGDNNAARMLLPSQWWNERLIVGVICSSSIWIRLQLFQKRYDLFYKLSISIHIFTILINHFFIILFRVSNEKAFAKRNVLFAMINKPIKRSTKQYYKHKTYADGSITTTD